MKNTGIKICSLRELIQAAHDKKSVVVPDAHCWEKPIPAAFMINQPGATLHNLFHIGMYVYVKENKAALVLSEYVPRKELIRQIKYTEMYRQFWQDTQDELSKIYTFIQESITRNCG